MCLAPIMHYTIDEKDDDNEYNFRSPSLILYLFFITLKLNSFFHVSPDNILYHDNKNCKIYVYFTSNN